MKNRLSPSILAADFGALKEDMLLAEEAGAAERVGHGIFRGGADS